MPCVVGHEAHPRYGVDFSAVSTGAGRVYAENLLRQMSLTAWGEIYAVVPPIFDMVSIPQNCIRFFLLPRWCKLAAVRVLWLQIWLPIWMERHRLDALLSPTEYTSLLVRRPVVLGIQNMNPYSGPAGTTPTARMRDVILRLLTRASIRRAHTVFFVSKSARDIVLQDLAIDHPLTSVIPHGVSNRFFEERSSHQPVVSQLEGTRGLILSVGAVRVHKDFHTLISAFARLVSLREQGQCEIPDLQLAIAGSFIDRPYLSDLREHCLQLRLSPEQVCFLGEIESRRMPSLYRDARLVVLPSHCESFGLPILESLAAGVPTVASDIAAHREVGGAAVIYYPTGDVDQLVSVLHQGLTNQQLRARLISQGRRLARQYTWAQTADRTTELLAAAAASGHPENYRR